MLPVLCRFIKGSHQGFLFSKSYLEELTLPSSGTCTGNSEVRMGYREMPAPSFTYVPTLPSAQATRDIEKMGGPVALIPTELNQGMMSFVDGFWDSDLVR